MVWIQTADSFCNVPRVPHVSFKYCNRSVTVSSHCPVTKKARANSCLLQPLVSTEGLCRATVIFIFIFVIFVITVSPLKTRGHQPLWPQWLEQQQRGPNGQVQIHLSHPWVLLYRQLGSKPAIYLCLSHQEIP